MRYPVGAIIWFVGGSFSMMALVGSVVKSFEPHHPALILATFMLMGLTALCYFRSGLNFHKWQQEREQKRGIRKCIEGAKTGWKSPITGITYPYHGHED